MVIQSSQSQNHVGILSAVFVILVVAALIWLVVDFKKSATREQVQMELPQGMTADMILEKGVAKGQIFTKQTSDGGTQSSLRYVSKVSADEILRQYEDYFIRNSWEVSLKQDKGEVYIISASKGNQQLIITSSRNSVTQDKIVDVTLLIKL